jgi:uncharacterized Zn finger protein
MIKPSCPKCSSEELEVIAQRYVEHGTKSPNEEPLREEAATIEYRCLKCGNTFDHVGRRVGR